MDVDDVWNVFFLYSLLLDHAEHGVVLELNHDAPSHAKHICPSLQAHTRRMQGTGQEEWNHACNLCAWVYANDDGVKREHIQLIW
jgi:hypothetical protein